MNNPPAERGGTQNPLRVQIEIAHQDRRSETGAPSAIDYEPDVYLLVHRVVIEHRTYGAQVQAVAFHQVALAVECRFQLAVEVGLPQFQAGGVDQLAAVGRTIDSSRRRHVADKPGLGRNEFDDDAAVVWFGVHLDVAVVARGEQALHAGAHHRHAQRLATLQRQNLEELGAFQRLFRGLEPDVDHRPPFVLLVLRQKARRLRSRQEQDYAWRVGERRSHQPQS